MIPERTAQSIHGLHDMCTHIKKIHPFAKQIVEIGAWTGLSMLVFSRYFEKIVSIDPWDQSLLEEALSTYDIEEVERIFNGRRMMVLETVTVREHVKLKMKSLDAVTQFNDLSLDVVHIDGAHDYENVKADIIAWLPKVKKDGIICGHDFHAKKFPGVIKAVKETIGLESLNTFPDTSWLKRKSEC